MSKSLLIIAVLWAGLFTIGYAQQPQQIEDPCARFKMRVVKPAGNLDPAMETKVTTNLDQAMVVNPCRQAPLIASNPTSEKKTEQKRNAILKFYLQENSAKTPSEILKEFPAPSTPKPQRP
ncbi:MAG: hypothetical protein ACKVZH_11970 [Blastocatellia bacterium]